VSVTDSAVSRREALAAIAAAAASTWAVGNPSVAEAATWAAQAAAGQQYQSLTAAQARELDAVTSTLVPSDGTPGAREARVVRFIDRSLATWAKDQKPMVEGALKALGDYVRVRRNGNASFAAVPEKDRTATLEGFEREHPQEFNGAFWFPTMAGMFTNPSYGGNANKVGWQLMGFKDQFSWAPPFGYYDRG
jgi:gluconate 2-dehydrogenase gamma chain